MAQFCRLFVLLLLSCTGCCLWRTYVLLAVSSTQNNYSDYNNNDNYYLLLLLLLPILLQLQHNLSVQLHVKSFLMNSHTRTSCCQFYTEQLQWLQQQRQLLSTTTTDTTTTITLCFCSAAREVVFDELTHTYFLLSVLHRTTTVTTTTTTTTIYHYYQYYYNYNTMFLFNCTWSRLWWTHTHILSCREFYTTTTTTTTTMTTTTTTTTTKTLTVFLFSCTFSCRIPPGVPRQAQRAIHQLRLNRLTSTASYQTFIIGQITSSICPHQWRTGPTGPWPVGPRFQPPLGPLCL